MVMFYQGGKTGYKIGRLITIVKTTSPSKSTTVTDRKTLKVLSVFDRTVRSLEIMLIKH